ncbi:MAG: hypothetical protein H6828_12155 [Planctomycetes bacterium]|nr:hypothetical protein [Planctomycetota bacterium]
MNDVRYRLERLRDDHLAGRLEAWRVAELRSDCAALRALDETGEYRERLEFIEEMLVCLLRNLASVEKLDALREQLKRIVG